MVVGHVVVVQDVQVVAAVLALARERLVAVELEPGALPRRVEGVAQRAARVLVLERDAVRAQHLLRKEEEEEDRKK